MSVNRAEYEDWCSGVVTQEFLKALEQIRTDHLTSVANGGLYVGDNVDREYSICLGRLQIIDHILSGSIFELAQPEDQDGN